jgi:hypothetical protein
LVPGTLLRFSVRGDAIVPHYLDERDHVWLRALVDEYERFVGRPRRALAERLRERIAGGGPAGKRALAIQVLDRVYGARTEAAASPVAVRAAVFAAAVRSADRGAALAQGAAALGVALESVEDALFADVPEERRVAPADRPVGPGEVALRANLALAQGLLFRASRLRLEMVGNARAVIRHAKLRGLICTVLASARATERAVVEVSGPLSILRRTLLYGRALAELVPLLGWCDSFRLRAKCSLDGRELVFGMATGDPVLPASEPRRYDSRLEERFARDFRRHAPGWDAVREPEPVEAGEKLIFPDFALQHRTVPSRRFRLEIVGFWTAEYLRRKLADLRAAGLDDLILCVDEDRRVSDEDLPAEARVIRFRGRIDPAAVLGVIER